jgi:hypothetical protein
LNKKLILKTKESLSSVLPITIIVLILNFTITPMPFVIRGLFLMGAVLLILGMGLFTLGADFAMIPMGEQIGGELVKSRKLFLLIGVSAIMGFLITMAEPDVRILAKQVPSMPNRIIMLSIAAGVGIFLVLALLRILFQWRLSYILIGLYLAAFILAAFVPGDFLPIAFDSGGVTTGPISAPFIIALGVGVSSVRGGKSSHDDSFGLVAFGSVGPIIAITVLGILYDTSSHYTESAGMPAAHNIHDLIGLFLKSLPFYMKEVALALLPILVIFMLFQFFALKLPKSQLIKMSVGSVYTYVGMVLFLTGASVGFMPAGAYIGQFIGDMRANWILIPLGMAMGFFNVRAEPAVHILNDEIEYMTGGAISKSAMLWGMSVGVSISIGLAMLRILYGVNILYILIPGYAIALGLTLFVPKIFTAIAFDSGGVAAGPMTATFLLPFALGACKAADGNVLTDAFGIVALVAMTPQITIQIMGLIYNIKIKYTAEEEAVVMEGIAEEIEAEEETIEWVGQGSDVSDYYNWPENQEFIENMEWASELREEKLYNQITEDNEYIDFEELQKLVLPEDFDVPRKKLQTNTQEDI